MYFIAVLIPLHRIKSARRSPKLYENMAYTVRLGQQHARIDTSLRGRLALSRLLWPLAVGVQFNRDHESDAYRTQRNLADH